MLTFVLAMAAKVAAWFGPGFATALLERLNSKDVQRTERMGMAATVFGTALSAEVKAREIASRERIALWSHFSYRMIIYMIVVPPAMFNGAVYLDSVFGFEFYDVDAPRGRFEDAADAILLTFIGATGAVAAAKEIGKRFTK
jgi:hypothetical protein